LSEKFFPYFFRVHLNILDTVVSTYAIFGTPCILSGRRQKLSVQNLEKHLIINWYNNKLSKSDCETEQFLSDTHGT
jgi:hypothetical protein